MVQEEFKSCRWGGGGTLVETFEWALKEKECHQDEMRRHVCEDPNARKPLQIPGVGYTTAYSLMARIEDITRFEKPSRLASYMGFNPSMCDLQGRRGPRDGGDDRRGGEAGAAGVEVGSACTGCPWGTGSTVFAYSVCL